MKDFLIESVAQCPRKVEGKEEREIYSSSFARQNYTKLHEGKDFFFKPLRVDSCRTSSVKRLKMGFKNCQ